MYEVPAAYVPPPTFGDFTVLFFLFLVTPDTRDEDPAVEMESAEANTDSRCYALAEIRSCAYRKCDKPYLVQPPQEVVPRSLQQRHSIGLASAQQPLAWAPFLIKIAICW